MNSLFLIKIFLKNSTKETFSQTLFFATTETTTQFIRTKTRTAHWSIYYCCVCICYLLLHVIKCSVHILHINLSGERAQKKKKKKLSFQRVWWFSLLCLERALCLFYLLHCVCFFRVKYIFPFFFFLNDKKVMWCIW